MIKSIFRYSIFCIMQIIVSCILPFTQKVTWEIPQKTLESVYNLGHYLTILMIAEIVIFIADHRTFIAYPLFWKIFYLLPIVISFMFVFVFLFGDVAILFKHQARILLSANIWGSIVGIIWSILLMTEHYNLR